MKKKLHPLKTFFRYFKLEKFKERAEYNRLNKLPAFVPTTTNILGHELSILDAKLFLLGKEEIFDRKIYQFESPTDQPVVIDCGANIGLSVIFIKQLFPKAKIIAFEPDPKIFKFLERNTKNFNLPDVSIYNQAVWTQRGKIEFFPQGGLSGRIPFPEDTGLISVPCVRLRDYLENPVDFLKIDIEGAETDVIMDCADKLDNVGALFVEYHSHVSKPQTLAELLGAFTKAGFRYHIKEAFGPKNPFIKHKTMLGMDMQVNIFCCRI